MDRHEGTVWRSKVEPSSTPIPEQIRFSQNQQQNYESNQQQQQLHNKKSLDIDQSSRLRNLNREILSASQSYNNTPKPFSCQVSQSNPQIVSNTSQRLNEIKLINSQQEHQQQQLNKICELQPGASCNQNLGGWRESQEENMSPKLVHKQYNSPIDLYSMNNIRKTIEAHTELIAPGIKGINFMKPETPVNKQSEVYKLVMEEEEQQRSRQASRISPAPAQLDAFSKSPASTVSVDHDRCHLSNQRSYTSNASEKYSKVQQEMTKEKETRYRNAPTCCECGQTIVGPFAKIGDRSIHPHCFNCTTCGSSLKNMGYFTINNKLYCEIHAKQVAKLMRLQYDFNNCAEKSTQDQSETKYFSNLAQSSTASVVLNETQESANPRHLASTAPSESYHQHASGSTRSPVTISSMFSERSSTASDSNSDRREINWTWRPANKGTHTSVSLAPSATPTTIRGSLNYAQQNTCSSACPMVQVAHANQQLLQSASNMVDRSLSDSSMNELSRVPICVRCHVLIHGPYILAGKTTWCKLCSQTNFNCKSCRRSLLDVGFIEDNSQNYYCENCYEAYYAPICSKCNIRIKGDCLNALGKQWHPSCFVCGHCHRPFGNSSFYLEDNVPYCERDWNILFTTKCHACSYPIEAGDKWIEALNQNYHSMCFKCTSCRANLEGSIFYSKNGKPYCKTHSR